MAFERNAQENRENWLDIIHAAACLELPSLPPGKIFKPKHGLPVLEDYRDPAPAWYWHSFPSNYCWPGKSRVDSRKLFELARKNGFKNPSLLRAICEDLSTGANIGCEGVFRTPGKSTNAPSSFEFGPHVSDAIADWITKGFAFGPVRMSEVPANAKINGIMCKQKPNGSVRIILNLSSPVGSAVNEGIDEKLFPATMSSTTKWLKVLNRAGRGCEMVKVDWSDAYKHVAVRKEDLCLQWFSWLGMAFCELCLIFGSKSSVGLYDRLAKLVLFIVCKESAMPQYMVCQHLDDCAAAAPSSSKVLRVFDKKFSEIAEELGIKLAPRDDPEKSFGPSTRGIVFGVMYDTVSWTWSIPGEKLTRILHQLQEGIDSDTVTQLYVMSICGKILDVKSLVPSGRFHIEHLVKAAGVSQIKTDIVTINKDLRSQLKFWQVMLRSCSGNVNIPDPGAKLPPWAIDVYTDASGGGLGSDGRRSGRGVGAVCKSWWAYIPWSRVICIGPVGPDGRRLNRKMSALELVGPLLVVSAGFKFIKNRPVKIWVDNSGSVAIWRKGYSTCCALSSTLVKAIAVVAAGLGCDIDIVKITRCSNAGADMADALSKADFPRFWSIHDKCGYNCPVGPDWVPVSLVAWLEAPARDDSLGDRILCEILAL